MRGVLSIYPFHASCLCSPSSQTPSFRYFANLANVSGGSGAVEAVAPSTAQLKLLYQRADGAQALTLSQVEGLCGQAMVEPGVVARVMQVGMNCELGANCPYLAWRHGHANS